MDETPTKVNPNLANEEELRQLPGVGPALAERILARRPFRQREDLQEVAGVGPKTLERWEPYLTFEAPKPEVKEPEAEAPEPKPSPPPSRQLVPIPKPPQASAGFSRGETTTLVIGAGVVGVILSVLLTLAVVAGINRTLDFGRHAALQQVRAELAGLESQLDDLNGQLATIDQRTQVLEGLGGRMAAVEDNVDGLQAEIRTAAEQVGAMEATLRELDAKTEALSAQTGRFQGFLEGLQMLLQELGLEPGS